MSKNLENEFSVFRMLTFLFISLIMVTAFLLNVISFIQPYNEDYTNFNLLNSSKDMYDFPNEVSMGENLTLFSRIENREGHSNVYLLKVKFGNFSVFEYQNRNESLLPIIWISRINSRLLLGNAVDVTAAEPNHF